MTSSILQMFAWVDLREMHRKYVISGTLARLRPTTCMSTLPLERRQELSLRVSSIRCMKRFSGRCHFHATLFAPTTIQFQLH